MKLSRKEIIQLNINTIDLIFNNNPNNIKTALKNINVENNNLIEKNNQVINNNLALFILFIFVFIIFLNPISLIISLFSIGRVIFLFNQNKYLNNKINQNKEIIYN